MAEKQTVIHQPAHPLKVHLSRGPSAAYSWEIGVSGDTMEEILQTIQSANSVLLREYGTTATPKKGKK